jgi:hypothetical protein
MVQILHILKVYPPWGRPMPEPGLNALALAYRMAFTIFGGYLAAPCTWLGGTWGLRFSPARDSWDSLAPIPLGRVGD